MIANKQSLDRLRSAEVIKDSWLGVIAKLIKEGKLEQYSLSLKKLLKIPDSSVHRSLLIQMLRPLEPGSEWLRQLILSHAKDSNRKLFSSDSPLFSTTIPPSAKLKES